MENVLNVYMARDVRNIKKYLHFFKRIKKDLSTMKIFGN
jgi:hypothetical protein